ncbi:MAG: prephenate dehydrogenase/arogenate dehydrogenase family protein [Mariprofundaceae bacterium]|nr:prephenate dehydrogenase/arogenate dehydrogenase family protein [Mariprofundaceae bacterium]
MIEKLTIIGVGLIGGSLALALKEAGQVGHMLGAGRDEANLKLAQSLGIVDAWTTSLTAAVQDADVVVLAIPMGAYDAVLAAISPALKAGCVVTDAGSTKQHALAAAARHLPEHTHFIAAHPIAGTEQSGAAAAFSTLYQQHLCIVTPDEKSDALALQCVKSMWQTVGCEVLEMPAAEHDDLLATVSHLPHLAAFAIVNAVQKQKCEAYDPFAFAAGGFRDFTRIASSSPSMWRDIALANRGALVKQIDGLQDELSAIKQALLDEDDAALFAMFDAAKDARDTWLNSSKQGEKS